MNDQNDFVPDFCSEAASDIDLSGFDAEYNATKASNFEEVPDGKYQVRIESVRLAESTHGDPMIKWDLIVINGPHAGRHVFKNSVVTQAALPYIKGDLKILGLELGRFSDLPVYLPTLLDKRLNITKRTKGEYTNVYFNSLITTPQPANTSENPF